MHRTGFTEHTEFKIIIVPHSKSGIFRGRLSEGAGQLGFWEFGGEGWVG